MKPQITRRFAPAAGLAIPAKTRAAWPERRLNLVAE